MPPKAEVKLAMYFRTTFDALNSSCLSIWENQHFYFTSLSSSRRELLVQIVCNLGFSFNSSRNNAYIKDKSIILSIFRRICFGDIWDDVIISNFFEFFRKEMPQKNRAYAFQYIYINIKIYLKKGVHIEKFCIARWCFISLKWSANYPHR